MFFNKRKLKRYVQMSDTELWAIVLNAPNAHIKTKDRYALLYALEAITIKKGNNNDNKTKQ